MSKDENVKTIRFPVKTDDKLTSLANKLGLSKLSLFIFMVDYFYKTKKDPRDLNDEMLKNAINRKTDNIVAFIKTQEQDLLIPMKKDAEHMSNAQSQILTYFNQHVIVHNREQKENEKLLYTSMKLMADAIGRLEKVHIDKQVLKQKFRKILENYISQRENLNKLFNTQAEKDALIQSVREQLENL